MRAYLKSDLNEVNGWLIKREAPLWSALPELGFIEPGVAVGFLLQAECGVAFLECYTNNPDVLPSLRHGAEKEITEALLLYGKKLGYKKIIALSKSHSIVERAEKVHGFKLEPEIKYLSLGA